jgi:cytochrome c-type biogenesis protein CcsB
MDNFVNIALLVSLGSLAFSICINIFAFYSATRTKLANNTSNDAKKPSRSYLAFTGNALAILSFVSINIAIIIRIIQTGHGPFSNMYEFATAFIWGIILIGFISEWKYKTAIVKNLSLILALLLLIFAVVQHSKPEPLVPALQHSWLLSLHVASAVVAYGTLTIGFVAAILFLVQKKRNSPLLPKTELLDVMSYQSIIIGFPFLTALIILGAFWADIAWGRYWSWDPKETASLVTWLIYAAYMHARVMRGWRGNRTAYLIIAGFAAILLTFFGNYIFAGLHAYG